MTIEIGQPVIGRSSVVRSAPTPVRLTIARNLRNDALRRGSSALHTFDATFGAEAPARPDAILSGAQDGARVRAAMRSLNPDQAQAIEMAFYQEQTHRQISRALGVPLGAVKARIRLA